MNLKRSATCRSAYFKVNPPPYMCPYCGKWLKKEWAEVDHIIPVAAARRSLLLRHKLKKQGVDDINDVRNLTVACRRCNRVKRDHTLGWFWQYKHGASKKARTLMLVLQIVVMAAGLVAAYFVFSEIFGFFANSFLLH